MHNATIFGQPCSEPPCSRQQGALRRPTEAILVSGGRQPRNDVSLNVRRAEPAKRRVLLVEDNLEAQVLVRRFLSKGYLVDARPSSRDAVTAAAERPYDLFIVDINLGYNDTGLKTLEALRRHARYAETPIMALTAYALPGDRERFLEAGFDAYVSKPFTKEQLRDTLQRLLQGPEQHG